MGHFDFRLINNNFQGHELTKVNHLSLVHYTRCRLVWENEGEFIWSQIQANNAGDAAHRRGYSTKIWLQIPSQKLPNHFGSGIYAPHPIFHVHHICTYLSVLLSSASI